MIQCKNNLKCSLEGREPELTYPGVTKRHVKLFPPGHVKLSPGAKMKKGAFHL
jgi:hypothetical protein